MIPDTVTINLVLFVIGLLVIIKGSDLFLDSAVWIASASGVSQIVIGATIVSLCTTAPELVSSCTASIRGAPDMALGNAVGSVICNTGLILGVVFVAYTAHIKREILLVKGTFMIGTLAAALCLALPQPGQSKYCITRLEGGVLLVILAVFLVVNYYESIHGFEETPDEKTAQANAPDVNQSDWGKHIGLFIAGGVFVAIGAYLLVAYGQRLARNFGVSEAVIALLFVALGTSLPELFTAISAIRKKAENISVGNIFGANVLNIALVTGSAAMIQPVDLADKYLARLDIPVALGVCSFVFLVGLVRGRIGRKTGVCLLIGYVGYIGSMFFLRRL